jgi:signal transduction histidine kinase
VLDRLPIRWKLAGISAALTFVILCGFAAVVGELTARQIRQDFNNELVIATDELARILQVKGRFTREGVQITGLQPNLDLYARPQRAAIRVLAEGGTVIGRTSGGPELGPPVEGTVDVAGHRVRTRRVGFGYGSGFIQYARRLSEVDATVRSMRIFLLFGVLAGSSVALAAGLLLARRAMAPIAALTATTREIARTRDPNRRVPVPEAEDEVSELARTLEEMLRALESSRAEGAAMLSRQRQFVADASHELRTPLTAVLANLELLAETLDGEQREAADAALRSSRRMRALVADLLLLARADARRIAPREPTDLARVVVEAASELQAADGGHHDVRVEAPEPVMVLGTRDELHRVALNLMENAVKHTPPGTQIRARVERRDGTAVLIVEDDGPGVAPELRDRLFERFVRGSGDRAGGSGSFGLGLSIVRAVANGHGGSVELADPGPHATGARFVVRLPAMPVPALVA